MDGLEKTVHDAAREGKKVHFVRYADDFICTAESKETLETEVLPVIIEFLKERGLELSLEKTKITHINEGFDFLGFNIRKYGEKLLIKPSDLSVRKFSDNIRETIKALGNTATVKLIASLNSKIRGWTNYYRGCVAKAIFNDIDKVVFDTLWRMVKRKHNDKNISWIRKKYFTTIGSRNWCFFCKVKSSKGKKLYTTVKAADTVIKRHIKIIGKATPYDEDFKDYFIKREDRLRRERINSRTVRRA